MINISYFYDPLESMGKPSPFDYLRMYISCPCRRAPLVWLELAK